MPSRSGLKPELKCDQQKGHTAVRRNRKGVGLAVSSAFAKLENAKIKLNPAIRFTVLHSTVTGSSQSKARSGFQPVRAGNFGSQLIASQEYQAPSTPSIQETLSLKKW